MKSNIQTGSVSPLNILRYWRNSLHDSERIGLSSNQIKSADKISVSISHLKTGKLSQDVVKPLFDLEDKKPSRFKKTKPVDKITVIIGLYAAKRRFEHAGQIHQRQHNIIFPLWMIADLTRSGQLMPDEKSTQPWLDRRFLSPNEHKKHDMEYPIIGKVESVDKFLLTSSHYHNSGKVTWQSQFNYATQLLTHITDNRLASILDEQHFELISNAYILPDKKGRELTLNILKTYDYYIYTKKPWPVILEQFCSITTRQYKSGKSVNDLVTLSQYHLGQMQNHYPLSASQRISLSYFFDEKDNDIFTVHGPPGTGKTSLLLSVIASKWVQAALEKIAPPLIVAASTNNMAVTNILDIFKRVVPHSADPIATRWLPDFKSFGLYLPAQSKIDNASKLGYYYLNRTGSSLASFYSYSYRQQAKIYFLEQFNQVFNQKYDNIKKCQIFLHKKMQEKQQILQDCLDLVNHFLQLRQEIADKYGSFENFSKEEHKFKSAFPTLQKEKSSIKEVHEKWLDYKTSDLLKYRMLSWIPWIKPILLDKVKRFVLKHIENFEKDIDSIKSVDKEISARYNLSLEMERELSKRNDEYQILKSKQLYINKELDNLSKLLNMTLTTDNLTDFCDKWNLSSVLDMSIRYDLFNLATHYWEAEWLLNPIDINEQPDDRDACQKYWQVQAMLMPCFVTTLHSGPCFFRHKAPSTSYEPLNNFIDLLIIDEAGQVAPAIAGAMVSIAKRVLLVGDAKQIEPIAQLPEYIDFANAKSFNLTNDHEDIASLKQKGILCSSNTNGHAYGNLITLGQRKAKYHLCDEKNPGVMLKEHRRCAKDIISYCNELCYDNQLLPLTEEKPFSYPRMGYAHIKGHEGRSGSSRYNEMEAKVIADWLHRNKDDILATCNANTLDDCVGIVTPFYAQSDVIRKALRKVNITIEKLGTIHSLQGAEKDIVILSTVYRASAQGAINLFFDKSPNMLNVAVSRAKSSFLVFGDMDIFILDESKRPSSILARHLFSDEKNEIVDIMQPQLTSMHQKIEVEHIKTLEKHRFWLKEAFMLATNELNIVSPFLSKKAIADDHIIALINEKKDNININIFSDPTLNTKNYKQFREIVSQLKSAGANVSLVNFVHSKLITIDDRFFIIGSFNWLSANRNGYQRNENSVCYIGEQVATFIEEAMAPIQAKATVNPRVVNAHEVS